MICYDVSGYISPRTYFPLIIIVSSSWVSFWLVNTPAGGEIVARVGLGITCCLGKTSSSLTKTVPRVILSCAAVVTVGFIGEENKVRVSYATALDVYIIICFAFVFMALVEFAFIHFVEMYVRRVRFKVTSFRNIFYF